jgi:phosphatidylglycerophosphate synthase
MALTQIIMIIYDKTFKEDIPNWIFLLCSISIIIYQTFDAMDGKHAKNTKSSSALGQVFDHGCDSFCLMFFLLCSAQACKLETNVLFMLFLSF